jgi:hypothetical protein
MKYGMTKLMAVIAAAAVMAGGTVYAQTSVPDTQGHEAHHPEGQVPAKAGDMGSQSGKMDSMKMDDMQGMMHQCMDMHKDGKMCDHEMMEKCEANMKKGECQKMMKQAKAHEKKEMSKK